MIRSNNNHEDFASTDSSRYHQTPAPPQTSNIPNMPIQAESTGVETNANNSEASTQRMTARPGEEGFWTSTNDMEPATLNLPVFHLSVNRSPSGIYSSFTLKGHHEKLKPVDTHGTLSYVDKSNYWGILTIPDDSGIEYDDDNHLIIRMKDLSDKDSRERICCQAASRAENYHTRDGGAVHSRLVKILPE
jgi:hypothetical protein